MKAPPFHAPRFGELVALAGELARDPGTSARDGRIARKWLEHRAENEALVRKIREWPRRADVLMKLYPGTGAAPKALAGWHEARECGRRATDCAAMSAGPCRRSGADAGPGRHAKAAVGDAVLGPVALAGAAGDAGARPRPGS